MSMSPRRANGRFTIAALLGLFLASGATSLIYETLWARQLHLVFGTSQLAICTVLAAFMGGLALGAFAAARWGRRIIRPVLAYALLEAFIAIYAIAFPLILKMVEPLYLEFWRAFEPSPTVFGIYQFLLVGVLLLPPTMCMGATLPLLARFVTTHPDRMGRSVGFLYGANTIGAVLGTFCAGFILLPKLGMSASIWIAAGANGLLAIAAAVLACRTIPIKPQDRPALEPEAETPNSQMPVLLLVAAVAGFSSLLYEVAWFRLMVLLLGGSTYAFSIMLLAFLLGLGIGGCAGGALADRNFRKGGMVRVLHRLALLQVGIALISWAAIYGYGELPIVSVWLFQNVETPSLLWASKLVLALAVMLPPATLMGATFPFLVRAATRSATNLERPVGQLYGASTVGAVIGAFAGGFILLPTLHVLGAVLAAASFNLIAALLAVSAAIPIGQPVPRRRLAWCTSAVLLAIVLVHWFKPPWNPMIMTSGMYQYAKQLEDHSRKAIREHAMNRAELLFYDEGLSSVVTVARHRSTGNIWLANNGKVDASSSGDLATQVLLAHLPFAFRPDSERILIIGLASGITAGTVTLHESPTNIDITEIEPAIVAASHMFDEYNHRPLEDPRVNLVLNDARNHLQLAEDGTYDLVISEPSNPWLSGVSNLFTQEFFSLGKRKLSQTGVWAQWLHCYSMNPDDLRSLLATFADTYAHVRLFRIDESDLVIVGSDAALPMRVSTFGNLMEANAHLQTSFSSIDIDQPEQLVAMYYMDRPRILKLAGSIDRNTDDNMRIEYSAPLNLNKDTVVANTLLLRNASKVPFDAIEESQSLAALASAYLKDGDMGRARLVVQEANAMNADDLDMPTTVAEGSAGDDGS